MVKIKKIRIDGLYSYQFIPEYDECPFREFIKKLYLKRLNLKQKNSPLQLSLKIILNSIYGKTGQKVKGRIGNMFNLVFLC